jgi:hypothetical protein
MLARILAVAVLACATAAAGAQVPAQPPADRGAAPPPTYQSAYEGYRPYVEEPLAPWREVNDTVERVGGHVGILRAETQATPTPPADAPKGGGHDAHHRK